MIDNDMRFISRRSDGKGWVVHISRSGKSLFSKTFSDDFYGGISLALVSSKEYRNSIQDEAEEMSKSIFAGSKFPPFYKLAQPNSKSQVVGLSRSEYYLDGKLRKNGWLDGRVLQ